MTDTQMLVLRLGGKGYSCAQIVMRGGLLCLGRENPDLLRAMAGLAHGGGGSGELCGALSGGLCLLGLHLGKGLDSELAAPRADLLLNGLVEWFRDAYGADYQITCDALLAGSAGLPAAGRSMDASRCGALVGGVLDQVLRLLLEHGFDPAGGREIPL